MADAPSTRLKHLQFEAAPETLNYRGRGRNQPKIFRVDRAQHAQSLKRQLSQVEQVFETIKLQREEQNLTRDFGLVLTITSKPGYPLKFTSFEQEPTKTMGGVVVLNVQQEQTVRGGVTKTALFVPFGRLNILGKKIDAYADPEKDGKADKQGHRHPKNEALLANIDSIRVAALEALWTDPDPLPEDNSLHWWEMWIRRANDDWETLFGEECARLGIQVREQQRLVLPDHVILIVRATRPQLESSLDLLNTLAEIRKPRPCTLGLTELPGVEQDEWIDLALDRIEWPAENAPSVCVIDTGVNRGHPLIEPNLASADMHTVLADGDNSDTGNHGTPMAGLGAFGDLRTLMLSSGTWRQLHRLESVKLIATGNEHAPENYGAVTQQAVYLPEGVAPNRPRVYCLAITRGTPGDDGRPSSWSAAIDSTISGSQEEGNPRRLLIVSAGNWGHFDETYDYPDTLHDARIEDPAQAWNAVTVGAYTSRITIDEDDDEFRRSRAVAPYEGLSPFSRTSCQWQKRWPIKPEVVMEGGNLGRSQDGDYLFPDSLQLATTSGSFRQRPVTTLNATSAAAAQASRLGAQLLEAYPDLWPEAVRGLLIHAARWTNEMLGNGIVHPHAAGSSAEVESLLRMYGFGAVNDTRALSSFSNQATVLIQNTLQPYKEPGGKAKLNECHLVELPWPKDLLEGDPDHPVTLRVTLSYFIEPNAGSRIWEKNPKYHYPGCLLRFKTKHKDISLEDFRAKLEVQPEDDEEEAEDDEAAAIESRSLHDPGWALGGRLRGKAGSLVQDVWHGTTGQLAEMDHLAIYPVKGWWATRKFPEGHEHHNCHERSVRYSLVVSIETEADLPIYSRIEAAITEIETQSATGEVET